MNAVDAGLSAFAKTTNIINSFKDRARQEELQRREDIQWRQSQEDRERDLSLRDADRKRKEELQKRQDIQWQRDQQAYSDKQDLKRDSAIRYKLLHGVPLGDDDISYLQSTFDFVATPEAARDTLERAKRLIAQAKSGRWDKASLLDDINTMYAGQINRGSGGTKAIRNFIPGPDAPDGEKTVIPELAVTGPDGKEALKPMTVNRGTEEEGDNEVKAIPLRKIFDDVTMRGLMADAVLAHALSKGGKVPKDDATLAAAKIKAAATVAAARIKNGGGRTGQAKPQSQIGKIVSDLVAMGLAKDNTEAYRMARNIMADPRKAILSIAEDKMNAQARLGITPGDPDYKSRDEIVAGLKKTWGLIEPEAPGKPAERAPDADATTEEGLVNDWASGKIPDDAFVFVMKEKFGYDKLARNSETGEIMGLRNGKWQKIN